MRGGGKLKERFWAKVEKTDTCWNWTGSLVNKGYGMIRDHRSTPVTQSAHRLSYKWHVGPIPEGLFIDHMCHNKACVNPAHLRAVTPKQNMENRAGASSNSKTGVRGVSWNKKLNRWLAQTGSGGRKIHVGNFDSIEEAEAAVIAKRNEVMTHNDLDRRAA